MGESGKKPSFCEAIERTNPPFVDRESTTTTHINISPAALTAWLVS
jgi:hypothetical protein